MDLRDDTHTQLKDHIATLRVMAKQKPPSELVMNEMTRYFEQAATLLEIFILPTIKEEQPYLDMRSGSLGNAHKVAPLVVGATSPEAAADDAKAEETPGFLQRNGSVRA